MDYSIVIPGFNEAGNIKPLIEEILGACGPALDYEILYVDDGSEDDTQHELRSVMSGGCYRLRAIRHPRRHGQSTAICTGVRAAHGRWIVTMDADGQNDPADIPHLLAHRQTCDCNDTPLLIAGQRRRRCDSQRKRIASRIANGVRRAFLGDAVNDTGCGLKLFPRAGFLELPQFDHMHRFLPALFQRQGGKVVVVEVNHRPRARGISKYGIHDRLWTGIVDLLGVMWLKRRISRSDYLEVRA